MILKYQNFLFFYSSPPPPRRASSSPFFSHAKLSFSCYIVIPVVWLLQVCLCPHQVGCVCPAFIFWISDCSGAGDEQTSCMWEWKIRSKKRQRSVIYLCSYNIFDKLN